MNQQINLYQPIFRKQKAIFSALAMLQVWGIIVLVMGAISAYTAVSLSRLEAQVTQGRNVRDVTRENVKQLKVQQLARTPSQLLESEVKRLRVELAGRKSVAALLTKGALSNTRGFSAQLEGLATHDAADSWLTEISIREGGAWLNLRGVALAPEVVPEYLQNLLTAEVFSSAAFNVLNLQAVEGGAGRVWFEAGTAEKGTGMAPSGARPGGMNETAVRRDDDEITGITRRTN